MIDWRRLLVWERVEWFAMWMLGMKAFRNVVYKVMLLNNMSVVRGLLISSNRAA